MTGIIKFKNTPALPEIQENEQILFIDWNYRRDVFGGKKHNRGTEGLASLKMGPDSGELHLELM